MKPDKYEKKLERLAEKFIDHASFERDVAVNQLVKLLRRVYRMGHKDGYWLGHNGHPISTNKKRGER